MAINTESLIVETITSSVVVTDPSPQTVVELHEDSHTVEVLTGKQGPQGRTIKVFSGPVNPSEGVGLPGDLFIVRSANSQNGDLYQKDNIGWGIPISKFSGPIESINGRFDTNIVLTKDDVGLSLADNTSDAAKPISTATQAALDTTVKLTGDQTIAGVKTFSSAPVVPDNSFNLSKVSDLSNQLSLRAPLASPTFTGVITGNGSGLTTLNASNLSSGTIADARLSTNVSLLNAAQTITGAKTFNATTIFGGSGYGLGEDTFFAWDNNHNNRFGFSKKSGAQPKLAYANTNFAITQYVGQTNINPAGAGTQTDRLIIDTNGAVSIPGTVTSTGGFSGPGGSLTGLSGSNISTGTVADARLSTNVVLLDNTQTISGVKTFTADTYISRLRSSTQITSVTSGTLGSAVGDAVLTRRHSHTGATNDMQMIDMVSRRATTAADWTTTNFYQGIGVDSSFLLSPLLGTGSRLRTWIGRDPQNQQIFFGSEGTTYLTLTSTAITASGTIAFTGNGSGLTSLNGSNISSGTVADTYLSSNIARLGSAATWNQKHTFITGDAGPIILVRQSGAGYASANAAITVDTDNTNGGNNTLFAGKVAGTTTFSVRADGLVTATVGFSGPGGSLTALNGTNISTGTVADARLSTNVALLTGTQTFTGAKTFDGGLALNDKILYIRANGDAHHTISFSTFVAAGGPRIMGGGGGELGYTGGTLPFKQTLQWDANGINVSTGTIKQGGVAVSLSTHDHNDRYVYRMIYTGSAYPARPSGTVYVEWVGPVSPPAATANDTWVNTSI